MNLIGRRHFFGNCVAATGALATDLSFLKPLGLARAQEIEVSKDWMSHRPEIMPIVRLIRTTPRNACVDVFLKELEQGLSYQRFLSALFLTASETGDLHQLAQIYAAHRISQSVRIEERLLPLFWALDRVKQGQDYEDKSHFLSDLKGALPSADTAPAVFADGMRNADKTQVERAVIALARNEGPRQAMNRLWKYAARDLGGTLGHLPIGVANAWRTLETIGWQHAEPALRYMARESCRPEGDSTFASNERRVRETVPLLPPDWASNESNRSLTLELYTLLRGAHPEDVGDLICASLIQRSAKAGAIWDAISLAAADLIYRHRTGGNIIGGALIHAITSSNALRYGFQHVSDSETRLIQLLQAAGSVAAGFIGPAAKNQRLRDLDLVEGLSQLDDGGPDQASELFAELPKKGDNYSQQHASEREASDQACRATFQFLKRPNASRVFMNTARTLLCAKASSDPHDLKYPAAAFEDAFLVSSEWRPYILASTVHALHGAKSPDSTVLQQVRNAI